MADTKVAKSDRQPGWCYQCNQLQMHYRPKCHDQRKAVWGAHWYCGVCGEGCGSLLNVGYPIESRPKKTVCGDNVQGEAGKPSSEAGEKSSDSGTPTV